MIKLTENRLREMVRRAVKMATRSVLNEAAGFTPNPDDYENSMFYSHDIPVEPDVSYDKLDKMVRTFKRAVDELVASIHDIEFTGIENFEDFYDELRRSGWNHFANDKI